MSRRQGRTRKIAAAVAALLRRSRVRDWALLAPAALTIILQFGGAFVGTVRTSVLPLGGRVTLHAWRALLDADPRGRLVGATVAAAGAGEAIAELTAQVVAGDKIDTLSTTVHAYPTLAEGPSRAADEHLRRKYASPRYRALARPILAARRRLGRHV